MVKMNLFQMFLVKNDVMPFIEGVNKICDEKLDKGDPVASTNVCRSLNKCDVIYERSQKMSSFFLSSVRQLTALSCPERRVAFEDDELVSFSPFKLKNLDRF